MACQHDDPPIFNFSSYNFLFNILCNKNTHKHKADSNVSCYIPSCFNCRSLIITNPASFSFTNYSCKIHVRIHGLKFKSIFVCTLPDMSARICLFLACVIVIANGQAPPVSFVNPIFIIREHANFS